MTLEATLTKENFWNEIMNTFPKATNEFCQWIDEYKKQVNWDDLFRLDKYEECHIKFHDIPYAMQQGIWIEFVNQNLHKYFEQPEYSYSNDLADEIRIIFSAIEELI